ncbi:hypothetical protein JCM10450v2_002761 [Rhodotorula kratochvilovae]
MPAPPTASPTHFLGGVQAQQQASYRAHHVPLGLPSTAAPSSQPFGATVPAQSFATAGPSGLSRASHPSGWPYSTSHGASACTGGWGGPGSSGRAPYMGGTTSSGPAPYGARYYQPAKLLLARHFSPASPARPPAQAAAASPPTREDDKKRAWGDEGGRLRRRRGEDYARPDERRWYPPQGDEAGEAGAAGNARHRSIARDEEDAQKEVATGKTGNDLVGILWRDKTATWLERDELAQALANGSMILSQIHLDRRVQVVAVPGSTVRVYLHEDQARPVPVVMPGASSHQQLDLKEPLSDIVDRIFDLAAGCLIPYGGAGAWPLLFSLGQWAAFLGGGVAIDGDGEFVRALPIPDAPGGKSAGGGAEDQTPSGAQGEGSGDADALLAAFARESTPGESTGEPGAAVFELKGAKIGLVERTLDQLNAPPPLPTLVSPPWRRDRVWQGARERRRCQGVEKEVNRPRAVLAMDRLPVELVKHILGYVHEEAFGVEYSSIGDTVVEACILYNTLLGLPCNRSLLDPPAPTGADPSIFSQRRRSAATGQTVLDPKFVRQISVEFSTDTLHEPDVEALLRVLAHANGSRLARAVTALSVRAEFGRVEQEYDAWTRRVLAAVCGLAGLQDVSLRTEQWMMNCEHVGGEVSLPVLFSMKNLVQLALIGYTFLDERNLVRPFAMEHLVTLVLCDVRSENGALISALQPITTPFLRVLAVTAFSPADAVALNLTKELLRQLDLLLCDFDVVSALVHAFQGEPLPVFTIASTPNDINELLLDIPDTETFRHVHLGFYEVFYPYRRKEFPFTERDAERALDAVPDLETLWINQPLPTYPGYEYDAARVLVAAAERRDIRVRWGFEKVRKRVQEEMWQFAREWKAAGKV